MTRRQNAQRRSITRLLLGVVVGAWLTAALAPCIMAASMDCCDHEQPMATECGSAQLDCTKATEAATPQTVTIDPPVLLAPLLLAGYVPHLPAMAPAAVPPTHPPLTRASSALHITFGVLRL